MAEITVERLVKRYGETLAVDDLSFTVDAGRVTGFLGPNGSGKSTTMRALLGLVRPTSGSALIMGRPFHELSNPVKSVGAALDAHDVHPGRSGRGHLRTIAAAAGLPSSRVDEVLDMVELTPARDRRVKGYSMGMRQRLALGAALLGDPKILMLDEPANGLDPQGMRWLRDILVALAGEGRAVLISSHVLSEVEQTVDSVVVIGAGRLVMQGPLADLVKGDRRPILVRSPRADELRELLEDDGASVASDGRPDAMVAHGTSLERIGTLAADNGIPIFELTHERATLEDRFLELTGESGNVR
ncbi:MAG TPA: ATP-binding cassette domain-containing protein [Solirubrobacteraceae bacterium]|jgi:ABC-2 type transport system ATP-binding protein|nr:ATP-binding cassette domain-containing protein [Solirubrobacteraceae bacterium]